MVVLGAGYTRGPWEFDMQGRWQSAFLDYSANADQNTLQPVTVGNYVVVNARAAYRVTRNLTVAFSALQFNNSHLTQAAAPPVERRLFLTLTAHL